MTYLPILFSATIKPWIDYCKMTFALLFRKQIKLLQFNSSGCQLSQNIDVFIVDISLIVKLFELIVLRKVERCNLLSIIRVLWKLIV